jgi:2-methylcitrate dehydratase
VTTMTTLAGRLAEYAHALRFEELPAAAVHEVKRRVIDALACAMGAIGSEPGAIARTVARSVTAEPGATVLGTTHRTAPDLAAFGNGALIRYLDYNDTYLSLEPAHPSDNISAALAVGEAERSDGRALITAILLAYELQCRLCDAASIRKRGWDHVTYGTFSTALLSARLMGLPPRQTAHALALAGVNSASLRQTRVGQLSMWKGCAFAHAARTGVFAATLARHGMTGPSEIFEGEMGFWKQVSGPFELPAIGGGDTPFKILDTSIKFYPAEYHAQSAIEAALALRPRIGDVENIAAITIQSFDAAVEIIGGDEEKWRPTSRETADHSLPYCVAVALMDGEVSLDQFTTERIADPALRRLMERIAVVRNAELTQGYPAGIPNRLEVTRRSGEPLVHQVTFPRGHARNPMTDTEVEEKFARLAAPVLPREQVDCCLQTLWHLEEIEDTGQVLRLFDRDSPREER